jgi:hypothetical protein
MLSNQNYTIASPRIGQRIFTFENGYGASVIQSRDFLTLAPTGQYEVAVLDASGEITYDTPVTDNVIAYLDDSGVYEVLERIQSL